MRILADNLLKDATITATNEDANYPVADVHDSSLLTRFQSTASTSVITCTLSEASTVSTFAFGNHNISTLAIKLTDSTLATTTHNYVAADLQFSTSITQMITYETAVTDIVEIEYTITAISTIYIGGLSAGQYIAPPDFDIGSKIGFISTGSRQKSRGGVSFNVPGVVLETFGCTINAGVIADFNTMNAFYALVQNYQPYYVDRWEESTEFPVLFMQNTSDVSWTKGPEGIIFDSFRLEMEECK